MQIGSCIDIFNKWVYHGWDSNTGIIMINVHLTLITLVSTLPKKAKGMLLGVSNLFEMHPTSMHVDLVTSLCTLGSGGRA